MAHTTDTRPPARSSDPMVLALRVTAIASVVVLAWQSVSAGELFGETGATWLPLHAVGAIVLHVATGLAVVAAALLWRLRGAPLWPTVLAAVAFVLGFVQAYFGALDTLWIHVPGAMVVTAGSVWLAVWSWRPTLTR